MADENRNIEEFQAHSKKQGRIRRFFTGPKKRKHIVIVVVVSLILLYFGTSSGGKNESDIPESGSKIEQRETNSTVKSQDDKTIGKSTEKIKFTIEAEQSSNEYVNMSKHVLNEGSEDSESVIWYKIAPGSYTVTNKSSKTNQINLYMDKTQKTDAGFEEPLSSTSNERSAFLLDPGASATIVCSAEEHFEFADGSFEFELQ